MLTKTEYTALVYINKNPNWCPSQIASLLWGETGSVRKRFGRNMKAGAIASKLMRDGYVQRPHKGMNIGNGLISPTGQSAICQYEIGR
jgi:hypothetical protein